MAVSSSSRFHRFLFFLSLVLLLLAQAASGQFLFQNAFPNLTFSNPVDLQYPPDGTNRLFVLEQDGHIRVFQNSPSITSSKLFLNIADSIIWGGEMGLLGLAFHPNFTSNRYFYIDYTQDSPLRTVIARYQVSAANPDSVVKSSKTIIMQIDQPFMNHNGGQIAFGPDGFLYIAMGDGGNGGDPFNNGQNKASLLGKILRINVDSTIGPQNYVIPSDNPFYGNTQGYKQEIYAYGLRNPWRFSFDPVEHTLWAADVGQSSWEEIDIIHNGSNCGWRIMEGLHCYNPPSGCDTTGLTMPMWEYGHTGTGECSITGGYVYRGSSLPALYGKYVYADFCTGEIWSLDTSASGPPINSSLLVSGFPISSFGVDKDNELYVCLYSSGQIYKFVQQTPAVPTLDSPTDGQNNVNTTPTLRWHSSPTATSYRLQVSTDGAFTNIIVDDSTLADTTYQFTSSPSYQTYFWRVSAKSAGGTSAYSSVWTFSTNLVFTSSFSMRKYWNIVSVPVNVGDGRTTTLFPTASSNAFQYIPNVGYQQKDTLTPIYGYWIKFNDTLTVSMTGGAFMRDTIDVAAGWNMVGSLTVPIPTSTIIQEPPNNVASQFFEYIGGYVATSTLTSGKGFWVKMNSNGKLILVAQ